MKPSEEIVHIKLENEMDLILAHKRSMRLAEMCMLSLAIQTSFATAVSEIARAAIGRKRSKSASMKFGIIQSNSSRKNLAAEISIGKDELSHGQEALHYAKRLADELEVSGPVKGKMIVTLSQKIVMSGLLTEEKIKSFVEYFKKEPPLSAYDEIRKKNIQLIALSDKLKESENDYKKLTETLPIMMFTLNPVGKITRTNEWLNTYFDNSSNRLNGMAWQTFIHPKDMQKALALWEKAQLEKQPLNIQARLKQKSTDTYLWHMINIVPLRDRTGNISEWAGFFVDINAQKLVEETLKNNEELKKAQQQLLHKNDELKMQKEFVETILDSSVDLMAVYDTNSRIISFNKKCEQVYRMKKEEIIGKSFLELFPTEKNKQAHRDLERALKGQLVHNTSFSSGLVARHYENFLIPIRDQKDKVHSVLVIAHDITEKVESEDKLKQMNEQLQKSNYDLEQFAYVASHDLQEPLRKIRNFSELLEENIESKTLRNKYLSKIDTSASRMATLINDMLNYSRLSSEKVEFTDIDLNKVLDNVKVDFELLIEEKQATVNSGKLPVIKGIPMQLHQLFSNLVNNSLKFSRNKPIVHISSSTVKEPEKTELQLDPKKDYVALVFKDNGIGFEQKYAEQIFTIFQRLASTEYSGTGIGLALCKKIVDKHQGRIIARGEKDNGAEFRIVLPVA